MPTTEWMTKYKALKDKLSCKIDLESYFTENVIGKMAVDVLDIGAVHFPTGTLFACDPLVELEDARPFIQTIPAGSYPVKICVVPSKTYGDRYACVKVEVRAGKPVRYELGMTGSENLDADWEDGDYFGFGVDAGMGCVADIQTPSSLPSILEQAVGRGRGHRPLQRPVLRPAGGKRQSPSPISRGLRRLAQLDRAGHRLQPADFRLRLGGWFLSGLLRLR